MVPTLNELDLLHKYICSALADTKRILLLYMLHEHPTNVTALAERLNLPQPTVSRHLAVLRERHLVVTERDGTSVVYRLADPRLIQVIDQMRSIVQDIIGQQADTMDIER